MEERIEAAASMADRRDHRTTGRAGSSPLWAAVWRWNRRRVAHDERAVERIEIPALDRAGDVDDQPVEIGVGPTFHRRYRTVVRGGALGAEEAMAAIQADPNVLADLDLAPFTKVRGASAEMRVGDRYVIEITGPWKGAVEVVDVSASFVPLGHAGRPHGVRRHRDADIGQRLRRPTTPTSRSRSSRGLAATTASST